MDFFTGQELIGACKEKALPISEIMKLREMTAGSLSSEEIDSKLETVLSIMKNAATMSASAIVEMMGGTPHMCLTAASLALSNLLGLVCDPIAGLVESPCQSRNAIGVANAITSAELALSGISHPRPFDEMAEAMFRVGKSLPFELRETAMGGCAGTPTGCKLGCEICK